jgi:hypothetical protein
MGEVGIHEGKREIRKGEPDICEATRASRRRASEHILDPRGLDWQTAPYSIAPSGPREIWPTSKTTVYTNLSLS